MFADGSSTGKKRARPLSCASESSKSKGYDLSRIVVGTMVCHQLLGMNSYVMARSGVHAQQARALLQPIRALMGPRCQSLGAGTQSCFANPTASHPRHFASKNGSVLFPSTPITFLRIQHTNNCLYSSRSGGMRSSFRFSTDSRRGQFATVEVNEDNWQSFSHELSEVFDLPSISVPSEHVHWLLSNKQSPIKDFLAHRMEVLEGIHPRIKVVRDVVHTNDESEAFGNTHQDRKRILLATSEAINIQTQQLDKGDNITRLTQMLPHIPLETIKRLVDEFDAAPGDPERITIGYQNQPVTRILTKLLPSEAQPPPSSYEQIGHVAHLNLRSAHLPYGKLIGSVMLDRLQPSIRTVVNKLGEVGGPYRTYQVDLIAGDDDYSVHVTEHGASLYFDLTKV